MMKPPSDWMAMPRIETLLMLVSSREPDDGSQWSLAVAMSELLNHAFIAVTDIS